jgi:hypothetical protein
MPSPHPETVQAVQTVQGTVVPGGRRVAGQPIFSAYRSLVPETVQTVQTVQGGCWSWVRPRAGRSGVGRNGRFGRFRAGESGEPGKRKREVTPGRAADSAPRGEYCSPRACLSAGKLSKPSIPSTEQGLSGLPPRARPLPRWTVWTGWTVLPGRAWEPQAFHAQDPRGLGRNGRFGRPARGGRAAGRFGVDAGACSGSPRGKATGRRCFCLTGAGCRAGMNPAAA